MFIFIQCIKIKWKRGERKRERELSVYVWVCATCVCMYLYCIIFIILIDIQQKICSCTIFHIVYLRNINQFEICMLLFMLNNESFSYSIICSRSLTHFFWLCLFSSIHSPNAHIHTQTRALNCHYRCLCVRIYPVCVTIWSLYFLSHAQSVVYYMLCMNEWILLPLNDIKPHDI